MRNKSFLRPILILAGLVSATVGAYIFAHTILDSGYLYLPKCSRHPFSITMPPRFHLRFLSQRLWQNWPAASVPLQLTRMERQLATSTETAVYDLDSYKQLRSLSEKENNFTVTWAPDGKELAIGSLIMQSEEVGRPHIVVLDTSTWETIFEPKLGNVDATMFLGTVAWSPHGRFLSTSDYERGLVTFDIKTGKVISLQKDFLLPPYDVSWSPNSLRVVATGDLGFGFRRWRIDTDESIRLYDKRAAAFDVELAWSPDGKQIASIHADGTVCIWTASTNQCDGFIKAHQTTALSLAWSPDGNQLVTEGGVIRIWDTHTGDLVTSFGLSENRLYSQLNWLSDGTLVSLEAGNVEGEPTIIRFWAVSTGRTIMEFHGASGRTGE